MLHSFHIILFNVGVWVLDHSFISNTGLLKVFFGRDDQFTKSNCQDTCTTQVLNGGRIALHWTFSTA